MIVIYGNVKRNTYPSNIQERVYGKANPIKHWRKQYNNNSNSKQISLDSEFTRTTDCSGIKQKVFTDNDCLGVKTINSCKGGKSNIKRNASTVINKNYYQSNKSYLESKNRTYEQNQTKGELIKDNKYKYSTNQVCNEGLTYKPNNKPFNNQGGVSSSINTLRIRNSVCIKCNKETKNTGCFCINSNNYYIKPNINL
jgi:hypothetical protein